MLSCLVPADHVVVVTATAETELPANEDEVEMGAGDIPREVALEVEDTVCSRSGAARPAPEAGFAWPAAGWAFDENGKVPMAVEGQPRIEVGHHYLMAIPWEPAVTVDGETVPGKWNGLDENAVLPYDDGWIGKGESEGAETTAQKAEHADEGADGPSIEKKLSGKSATGLAAALDAAKPVERQEGEGPADPDGTRAAAQSPAAATPSRAWPGHAGSRIVRPAPRRTRGSWPLRSGTPGRSSPGRPG